MKCSSFYAYRRVVPLYTQALGNQLQDNPPSLASNDDNDQQQNQQKPPYVIFRGLLTNLIRLLGESKDESLVELTQQSWTGLDPAWRTKMATVCYDVASSTSSLSSSSTRLAAVALGAGLETAAAAERPGDDTTTPAAPTTPSPPRRRDWLALVLQITLSDLSTRDDLAMARSVLQSVTAEQWQQLISPALQLKLKSHPDKGLETILGWIQHVGVAALDDEWMTLLLKQLQSPKDDNRVVTRDLLVIWARHSSDCLATCVSAVASTKVTLAPARVQVYEVLEQIAHSVNHPATATTEGDDAAKQPEMVTIASTATNAALTGLLDLLSKETKAEQRILGQQALVEWLVVTAQRDKAPPGYGAALDYIREPVVSKKSSLAGAILGLLIQRVHPELLETTVVPDLWKLAPNTKSWEQGLEGLVDAASNKKSVQVDGLMVVYFTLLYCRHAKKKVPAFIETIVAAGAVSAKGSSGASAKKDSASLMYSNSLLDAASSTPMVSHILLWTIALYTQLAAPTNLFPKGKVTAACRAMACAVSHPTSATEPDSAKKDQYASNAVLTSLETILTHQPQAAEGLVTALFDRVNEAAMDFEYLVKSLNATREARETDKEDFAVKGQASVHASHRGFDANAVRLAARVLSRHVNTDASNTLARILVLMHAGTSLRSDGHQRAALILNTKRVVEKVLVPMDQKDASFRTHLAEDIVRLCAYDSLSSSSSSSTSASSSEKGSPTTTATAISNTIHEAGISMLTSLGGVASNFDASQSDTDGEDAADMMPYAFCSKICIDHIAVLLDHRLENVLKMVEEIPEKDMLLFLSPPGTLFQTGENSGAEIKKSGGKRLSEEEEWELQMKKELAEKKKQQQASAAGSSSGALSDDDRRLLVEQDRRRDEMGSLLNGDYARVLNSIQYLCVSDIEVGNQCLRTVMESVIRAATSICPAATSVPTLLVQSSLTLTQLATCVYEIHEMHAPTIAQAIMISCRQEKKEFPTDANGSRTDAKTSLVVKELPSPCAPAACVIYEMDHFGDTFSGSSFAFLFPVIRASLMGPRTPPGCEAALRVLERHTALLFGEEKYFQVATLRREMAIAVLELLKHDRAQTFQDPTALDTLVKCYNTDEKDEGASNGAALTTAELAPLLDERGALGTKSCRVGAMHVFNSVAERHRQLLKTNPLVENRIWLNCFEKDEEVRTAARRAWLTVQNATDADLTDDSALPPPSPLYAAPLLPLLSHSDSSIAFAAAAAFGDAMGKHPKSVPRNIEKLCSTYIDSFPSESKDATPSAPSKPATAPVATIAAPKKATLINTGLPKKKAAAPKSALAIAGIGKPKPVIKKKLATSALLKPKEERKLDKDELENMFKTGYTKKDVEKDSPGKIAVRLGVIRAIVATTVNTSKINMDEPTLKLLTSFLMAYGIADMETSVKAAARDALRDVVASSGGSDTAVAFLLPHLEGVLKNGVADESSLGSLCTTKVPKDIDASDRRKEAVVVALGSVALHLKGPESESKIDSTIDMLIAALKTPSEDVQLSVADALTKLMKKGKTQDRLDALLSTLLRDCLNGESLAIQRGSAYGLAAVVKGSGIASLKKFEVVKKLEEACASGNSKNKEGSLFAIELLSDRLGLLFEPYVISLLPSLLKSFSDGSDHVRKAAATTVGVIMGKLSAHGVKLVMPAVLTAFNDPAWRTKQASIHMLGSMSHLAPKQLASALPKVVPKLTEAFGDTHPKVKASAQEALTEISTVVRNPEISEIAPALLKALTDPADHTVKALETLIETEFLHAIDAPSLALIVPILHRGLRDRGATTKRFSGLITGNITTMINDSKDLIPYLPTLLPDLQMAILDPIPDVRSTAAKALGSLTRSLGDQIIPELRPWLIKKLREENCSSAERSGAAQGLTEVLIACGGNVVEDAMRTEILPLRNSSEPSTREGVLWMLTFLPPAMGQAFTPLIDASFPVLIGGLSDDSEPVRDAAMRAGRVLIRSHGKVHVDKILPSLEDGLAHDDYRIRLASLSLLGDLLSLIGGTTLVKGDGDTQDDIRKAERAQAQLALALGSDTRKRVLSGLYVARSDSIHAVRASALQVWKTVVSVTGRTLREILPVLVAKVIDDLASGNEMKTVVAGRCLGDVVSKLGESVLPQIIPVLRNALYDGDEHTKRGVCVGLSDVIQCSTKEQILRFIEIVSKVVQDALCDDSESVRKMAAASFQSLHNVVGNRAFDEIVPSLMVALERSDNKAKFKALHGLTGILTVRSRELLPYIVPRLINRPITEDHAKALAGVAAVTGSTLFMHYSSIIPALLLDLADQPDEETTRSTNVRDCCRSICSCCDEAGVNILISEISSKCGNDKAALRRESCRMLELVIVERESIVRVCVCVYALSPLSVVR